MGHIFKDYAKTGLVVSSILFGLSHFSINSLTDNFNPFNILSYVMMGFFFGWVYYKTKRIEASIMAHLMNNLLATGVLLIVM
jgi:membrane protease YdiL (CAAX protease family)